MFTMSLTTSLVLSVLLLPGLQATAGTLNQTCDLSFNQCSSDEYCDYSGVYPKCSCKENFEVSSDGTVCTPKNCTLDTECGKNAHCVHNTCVCNHMHHPFSNNGQCERVPFGSLCMEQSDCDDNMKCINNYCICNPGYAMAYGECKKFHLKDNCKIEEYGMYVIGNACGNNAYCKFDKELTFKFEFESHCTCYDNFKPTSNGIDCERIQCHSDWECAVNSECDPTIGCRCKSGFQFTNYTCSKTRLGQTCDPTKPSCGEHAECIDGKCLCQEYHYPNSSLIVPFHSDLLFFLETDDHVNCRKPQIFGEYCSPNQSSCGENAFCREQVSQCLCLPGFAPNHTTGVDCKPVHNSNYIYCKSSPQCGTNSHCADSHCVCDQGFKRSADLLECEPIPQLSCLTFTEFVSTLIFFFLLGTALLLAYHHCSASRLHKLLRGVKFAPRVPNQPTTFCNPAQEELEVGIIASEDDSLSYRQFH